MSSPSVNGQLKSSKQSSWQNWIHKMKNINSFTVKVLSIFFIPALLYSEKGKFSKNDITVGLILLPLENTYKTKEFMLNRGIEAGFFVNDRIQIAGRFFCTDDAVSSYKSGYSLEPYTVKGKLGEMVQGVIKYFPEAAVSKIFGIITVQPSIGMSVGYLNSMEYVYRRDLPDGTAAKNTGFSVNPDAVFWEYLFPLPDSYTVFIPKRNFIGYLGNVTFLTDNFFFGIELSSNLYQKVKADVLYNSDYLHYSKAPPFSPQEIYIKQIWLRDSVEADKTVFKGYMSMIFLTAGVRF